MKISEERLREIIREEFMRGVPEFVLRQETSKYIGNLRVHAVKFIELRADNPVYRRELVEHLDKILKELEDEIDETTMDRLHQFVQNV